MSTNLPVSLEMLDHSQASDTGARNVLSSQIYLDPSLYDGATYYFEVDAYNSNADTDYYIQLYDATATANLLTDNAGSGLLLPKNIAAYTRYRSLEFTPNAGKHVLYLTLPATAVASNLRIGSARIIVVQVGATKTRLQFPLLHYSSSTTTSDTYTDRRAAITYAQNAPYRHHWFLKNSAVFGDLIAGTPWTFEAVLNCDTAAHTGYANLRNFTDSADVTGSELSITGTTITITDVALANDAENFHDGDIISDREKSDNASYNGQIFRAALYVTLENLSKGEVFCRVGCTETATTAAQRALQRFKLELNSYSGPICYFECAGLCADDAIANYLCDDATDDTGTGGWSDIAGINWNSATKARYRSGALALTNDYRYVHRTLATTGTHDFCSPFIVVAFTGSTAGTCPLNLLHTRIIAKGVMGPWPI